MQGVISATLLAQLHQLMSSACRVSVESSPPAQGKGYFRAKLSSLAPPRPQMMAE